MADTRAKFDLILRDAPSQAMLVTDEDVEKWASIDMTIFEIAKLTRLTYDDIYERFGDALARGRVQGNLSLKFRAYEKAMSGDTQMLIFLMKNRVGYVDKLPDQHVNTVFNISVNELPV